MPLIHFMVVTSYRKTVSVAICFVVSEEETAQPRDQGLQDLSHG
jgi:hypothetical protein